MRDSKYTENDSIKPQLNISNGQSIEKETGLVNEYLSKHLQDTVDSSNGNHMKELHTLATLQYRLKEHIQKDLGSRVPWVSRLMMAHPCRNLECPRIKA